MKSIKTVTVSVGIPALNEEANIKKLLKRILNQRSQDFVLEKVIVISDGSTDNTENEVSSISDDRILLSKNRNRIGKALSQNKLKMLNTSDILVILDADVLPKGREFLNDIIAPILKRGKVGLVGAKVEPIGSRTFIGKVIDYSAEFKHQLYCQKKDGHNVYNCHGRARAFSKVFLRDFTWDKTISEDAFSYFACLSLGFEFAYQPRAVVLYKSPQTIQEHMKQSVRFMQGQSKMETYFEIDFVRSEYSFSISEFAYQTIRFMFKNPVLFFSYCGIYIWAKLKSKINKMTEAAWDVSRSSKLVAR